jgi:hypothetical protein
VKTGIAGRAAEIAKEYFFTFPLPWIKELLLHYDFLLIILYGNIFFKRIVFIWLFLKQTVYEPENFISGG